MPLKYYTLAPSPPSTASSVLVDEFQALVNEQFDVASDVFTIQEEYTFASGSYVPIEVRITGAISSATGQKLGDDFKTILFKDPTHPVGIGRLYYFDTNYWLCTFSEAIKSLSATCTVRRCNERLRWIDSNGVIYSEPCVVDYEIIGTRDLTRKDELVLPQGYVDVFSQLNSRTEKIKPNHKFLFGRPNNRIGWRVFGNGIMNTQNQVTDDETTSRLLTLTLGGYQTNETEDNFALGISDYYKNVFTMSLLPSSISGNVAETHQLNAVVENNSIPTSASITYASSASFVTVSASGLVTLVASGSSALTAYMGGNTAISASIIATVSASGITTNEIRITPSDNVYILEESSMAFTSYLYTNGVQQADVFTFAVADSNVPVVNYTLSAITGNGFTVTNNNKYLNYPLLINAVSGSYTKQISILLKGAW